MSKVANPQIAERNDKIVDAYLTGSSSSELAQEYGLSIVSINKMVNKSGRKRDFVSKKRAQSFIERKPISQEHVLFGSRISYVRIFILDIDVETLALKANISRQRLYEIQQGFYNASFQDYQKIATALGVDVFKIIHPKGDKLVA